MVLNVSPRISLPLSALMIVFSTFILFLPDEGRDVASKPLFTAFRDKEGEIFAARRIEQAFVHYYLLHALPATIWSVVMPLQYWDSFRKARPTLHRFTGYIAASCSLLLTITGLAFIPAKLSYSAPIFTIHYMHGYPLFPSFNFSLVFFAAPAMLITGSRAIYLARNKRFVEHRRWAVYHGISGYVISLQRVWMLIFNAFGVILNNTPELQRYLETDLVRSVAARSDAEMAAFAFTTYAAGLTSLIWYLYIIRQNASKGQAKAVDIQEKTGQSS